MAVAVKPTAFAQATGTDPSGLRRALENGQPFNGWPVSSWAVQTPRGYHLNVPDEIADAYSLRVEERQNPGSMGESRQLTPVANRTWADAVAETAVPVSANVGASTVLWRYADVIEQQPQLFARLTDLVAMLGGAALVGYFTDEETPNRALKVMGGGAGGYAVWSVFQMVQEEARHRQEMERRQLEAERQHQLAAYEPPETQLPESTTNHLRRLGA